jgi:predicted outer membrane protein
MKLSCKTLVLGGALLASFSCGAPATQAAPAMMEMKMAGMQLRPVIDANLDKMFMLHAAQGNMAEIMTGQLALRKSRNAGVRMVAQTLIAGHSAAQKDLAKHFAAMGMPMPRDPGAINKAVYKNLSGLRGRAFDRAFMAGQVEAHEKTIVLFEHESMSGKNEVARAHARNKLPDIIGHTAMIYTVAKQVGAPGINLRPAPVLNAAARANRQMMDGMKMGGM